MPLPNVTNGTARRCRARTKSRDLAPCLNLAAFGTPVCKVHGAVHPDKRSKGNAHGKFKHGFDTVEAIAKQRAVNNTLRSLEQALVVTGAVERRLLTKKLPAGCPKIKTLRQVESLIFTLENLTNPC